MADDYGKKSRSNRFSKKRKNTKALTILYIAGIVLLVVLIAIIFFGGNDEETPETNGDMDMNEETDTNDQNEQESQVIFEDEPDEEESAEDEASVEREGSETDETIENDGPQIEEAEEEEAEAEEEESENNSNVETYEVEPADDNVRKAYEGNWEPVGTEQEGPHTPEYDNGSVDRQEMAKAVEVATGIPAENQITWWAGRGGDQKVELTVSPETNEQETYRVHLVWVDGQGWQPTLVEELIENDKK
ncbi:Protein of unknown function [Gracilibacillus ureilyticus]|uniref:DUF1510 domain-containing protein n=1 Tax=Gracilibacillus ureilyticus TaxID=531814 RepID=A0A1H9RK66_9BACI|nr:YrrS family protein [Gracilibacillus ureilyticus]SER73166.1 Protein of unknown function [Gracilibacillus ureilyticus]